MVLQRFSQLLEGYRKMVWFKSQQWVEAWNLHLFETDDNNWSYNDTEVLQ